MTKPRQWATNAADARDQAAEGLNTIIRLVRPLIQHDDKVVIVRASLILDHAQNAVRKLEQYGAQTEPDDVGSLPGASPRLDKQ